MAKIFGLFGAMTGKVADVVMVVRNGVQVARKYQPVVSNPSTPSQVAARARLKLMSQLAAVCSPVIAIPREGIVSARNKFVAKNYPLSSYAVEKASILLESVQLTDSVVALPPIAAARGESGINASLSGFNISAGNPVDVDRVVYVFFDIQNDEKLRYVTSAVANEAGANGQWAVSNVFSTSDRVLVLAYGVRSNSEVARALFGSLEVPTAENIARLVVSRALLDSDITVTETRGTLVAAQV